MPPIYLGPEDVLCPVCKGAGREDSCFDCGNKGYLIKPCTCGDRRRPFINHRSTIPCWAYIGGFRVDVRP